MLVIDLTSLRLPIVGSTTALGGALMVQVTRSMTDAIDRFLLKHRTRIMDRGSNIRAAFCAKLTRAEVEDVRVPLSAPKCNAHAERFVLWIEGECVRERISFDGKSVQMAVSAPVAHDNRGLAIPRIDSELIERVVGLRSAALERVTLDEQLMGLLRSCRASTARMRSCEVFWAAGRATKSHCA